MRNLLTALLLMMTSLLQATALDPEMGFEIYADREGYKLTMTIPKTKLAQSIKKYCLSRGITWRSELWEMHIADYLNDNFSLMMDEQSVSIKVQGFIRFGDSIQVSAMLEDIQGKVSRMQLDNTCFLENDGKHINLVKVNLNGLQHRLHLDARYDKVSIDYNAQESLMINYDRW